LDGWVARLLVVHHSPTAGVRALTEQVLAGAHDDAIEGVEVVVRAALEATADDVLAADGYLLGTPANFGYMSGALKHFFDSTFLAVGGSLSPSGAPDESEGRTTKRPFGLWVHGRYDTVGAVRSVLSIVGALGWRQSADVLEVLGDVEATHLEAAYDLGGTLAALLADS
jgi:multimeric flavodoxin WrbA